MTGQQKGPLLGTAALRWEVSTSRGNDTKGRNPRVFLEMGSPFGLCHPVCGEAGMHQSQPFGLESTTIDPIRK
jgi:hypothetical protein